MICVVFKKYANLEFLNKNENCNLIIDDSCEGIYNDKKFVKLVTLGRHKNFYILYLKHNLYK